MGRDNRYKSKTEVWRREMEYARRQDIWFTKADELVGIAGFLLKNLDSRFTEEEPRISWFGYNIVRMLYGFSLENYLKGLVLSDSSFHSKFVKDKRIDWGFNGHDLLRFTELLKLDVSEEDEFYFKTYCTAAEWHGRYPFPSRIEQLVPERTSFKNRTKRLERRRTEIRDGKVFREQSDLLSGLIGSEEKEFLTRWIAKLKKKCETLPA